MSTPAPAQPTPKTWREYFDTRRTATEDKDRATREHHAAAQRFHQCDDRLRELEASAERAAKATPFTGANLDEPWEAPR